jgi:hypothetical protein
MRGNDVGLYVASAVGGQPPFLALVLTARGIPGLMILMKAMTSIAVNANL